MFSALGILTDSSAVFLAFFLFVTVKDPFVICAIIARAVLVALSFLLLLLLFSDFILLVNGYGTAMSCAINEAPSNTILVLSFFFYPPQSSSGRGALMTKAESSLRDASIGLHEFISDVVTFSKIDSRNR